jgi:hypothetical protein
MACLCRRSWASWIPRLWGKEGGEVQMAPALVPRLQVRVSRPMRPLQRARPLKPILLFQLACLSSAASPPTRAGSRTGLPVVIHADLSVIL